MPRQTFIYGLSLFLQQPVMTCMDLISYNGTLCQQWFSLDSRQWVSIRLRLLWNHAGIHWSGATVWPPSRSLALHSLAYFSIPYDASGLHERVLHLISNTRRNGICHIHITGGPMPLVPGSSPQPTEIISCSALPTASTTTWEFMHDVPNDYFNHKSMAYAPHIHSLVQATHWPIYVDPSNVIMDASLFALGCIQNDAIVFAAHTHQVPSVSRDVILSSWTHSAIHHQPLSTSQWQTADCRFACNAVRGYSNYRPHTLKNHPFISSMNDLLGFDDGQLA